MKISTLVAAVALSGLIPTAWACDYGKPTDASVAAPAPMASIGTPATSAPPVAASKASTPTAAKPDAASAVQKRHAKSVAVACEGGGCE